MELHLLSMAIQVPVQVVGTQLETTVRCYGATAGKRATKDPYYKICCRGYVLSDPESCICVCQGHQTFDQCCECHL